jgi:hypothetical protein
LSGPRAASKLAKADPPYDFGAIELRAATFFGAKRASPARALKTATQAASRREELFQHAPFQLSSTLSRRLLLNLSPSPDGPDAPFYEA